MREVEVQFAVSDGACVAYQVFGAGPIDLLLNPGNAFPIDLMWDLPQLAEFMDALGRIARVIAYDPRGMGASDGLPTADPAAVTENQASDVLAVLDAVGSERTSILTFFGSVEMVVAATYPHRVRSLIMINFRPSFPELRGLSPDQRKSIALWLSSTRALKSHNPRVSHDPVVRQWWGHARRLVCNPDRLARVLEYAGEVDSSSVLENIRVPTLILHRTGNQVWDIESSRKAAAAIPDYRFVELPGTEHDIWFGDTATALEEITRFLREPDVAVDRDDRSLATVLFTDIVNSTEQLASVGDHKWLELLDELDGLIDKVVAAHRGRVVRTLGDGILATFDGPARAVRCACSIRDGLASRGVSVRAGLHTGEIERLGGEIGGMAVHTGARVATCAGPGEVLVSSTVRDLVAGSGIEFTDRGEHQLKGVPGTWRLFAVDG
jgi:class 3 adenylate cyclase